MTARIIVRVEGGGVQSIEGIPAGVVVEVRDYDYEGDGNPDDLDAEDVRQDEHGRFHWMWEWVPDA